MTDQLLTISRRSLAEPTTFDLNHAVLEIVAMLRRVIGTGIDIETRLGEDVECVRLDQGQFEQSILNLAVNARDAMPDGGKIWIETCMETLDEVILHPGAEPGRYVSLVIRDSGQGIDEDVEAHIFEPFFTTKARGKGTGLGLSMVYAFVKHNGGHIEVESAPGEGATFRLLLPHVEVTANRTSAEVVVPLARREGAETILVVEDEEPVREVLCSILRAHGYVVIEAGGPLAALERMASSEWAVDLLLTDVVMPTMTGLELADLVLETHPETRVLFISGYSGDAWR